jgi:hypothetical protein
MDFVCDGHAAVPKWRCHGCVLASIIVPKALATELQWLIRDRLCSMFVLMPRIVKPLTLSQQRILANPASRPAAPGSDRQSSSLSTAMAKTNADCLCFLSDRALGSLRALRDVTPWASWLSNGLSVAGYRLWSRDCETGSSFSACLHSSRRSSVVIIVSRPERFA